MKKMKKVLALLTAGALLFGCMFTSCSNGSSGNESGGNSTTTDGTDTTDDTKPTDETKPKDETTDLDLSNPYPYTESEVAQITTNISEAFIKLCLRTKATAFLPTETAPAANLTEGIEKYTISEKYKQVFYIDPATDTIYYYNPAASKRKMTLGNTAAGLFMNCQKITKIDLSGFDTRDVTSMENMFKDCKELIFIQLGELVDNYYHVFNTDKVTTMEGMFSGCEKYGTVGLTNQVRLQDLKTDNLTSVREMFKDCKNLRYISFNTRAKIEGTGLEGMFSGCETLHGVFINYIDTSLVTSFEDMFLNCKKLKTLDELKYKKTDDKYNWDVSNVTNFARMFCGCESIEKLELSNWDTSKGSKWDDMFSYCHNLKTIQVWTEYPTWTGDGHVFKECWALEGGNGTKWDGHKISMWHAHVDEKGNPGYFTGL